VARRYQFTAGFEAVVIRLAFQFSGAVEIMSDPLRMAIKRDGGAHSVSLLDFDDAASHRRRFRGQRVADLLVAPISFLAPITSASQEVPLSAVGIPPLPSCLLHFSLLMRWQMAGRSM
jgi:hypothetical protein